jgi:uncharacterized repeat protein (TIGR03803 family)
LLQGTDGNFYGTTYNGGGSGNGTIFKITPQGQLTTLHSFNGADGSQPASSLVEATDGDFYGTTLFGGSSELGTIFKTTPDGTVTELHTFLGADGAYPEGALLQATNGTFYGTTSGGGGATQCDPIFYGCGTFFSLDTCLGPFVTFVRDVGKIGQTGPILGQGFTGTTSVSLNGTPASFTVVSDTLIHATVPQGATTGYITVTTPSGTLISNLPFHVIR